MNKKADPDSESFMVSISLARLKLSTLNRITSCKEITNALIKIRKQPRNKNQLDSDIRDIERPLRELPIMEKCKNSGLNIKSQKILREPDKPRSANNPSIGNNKIGSPPKRTNSLLSQATGKGPENLKVITIDEDQNKTDSSGTASKNGSTLKSPPRALNDHIVIKHNLPVFVPPRRERYTSLPTAYKHVKTCESQTDEVFIVTEEDSTMLQMMKAKGVTIDSIRHTIDRMTANAESDEETNEDINNNDTSDLQNSTDEVIDLCDTDDNNLVNDELLNTLLNQSAQNKALLKKFYGSIDETVVANQPKMNQDIYNKIVNASTIINQVLVKDVNNPGQIILNKAVEKITSDKDTQTKMTENSINKNFKEIKASSYKSTSPFSPVSDTSDSSTFLSMTIDAAIETDRGVTNQPGLTIQDSTLQAQKDKESRVLFQEQSVSEPQYKKQTVLAPVQNDFTALLQSQVNNPYLKMGQQFFRQLTPEEPPETPPIAAMHAAQPSIPRFPFQLGNNNMNIVPGTGHQMIPTLRNNENQEAQKQFSPGFFSGNINYPSANFGNNGRVTHTIAAPPPSPQPPTKPPLPPQQLMHPFHQQASFGKPWNMQSTLQPSGSQSGNSACLSPQGFYPQLPGIGAIMPTSTATGQRAQDIRLPEPAKPARKGRPKGVRNISGNPYKRFGIRQQVPQAMCQTPQSMCQTSLPMRPTPTPTPQVLCQTPQPLHQTPQTMCQSPQLNKYQVLMEQQKRKEMEIQQRNWESQLQNYPNSSWTQNFRNG